MPKLSLMHGDARTVLQEIPNQTIDLVITSPPYNLKMAYEPERTLESYIHFITQVLEQIYIKLKPNGRVCWNVPNQIRVGRDGQLWSPSIKTAEMMEKVGLKFFDLLIWDQGYSDSATAWGSWQSPNAPFIGHRLESILVYHKGTWNMQRKGETDLTPKEFMSLTKGELWRINPENNREHPAPFPIEIPRRCIKLFSFIGDTILDPFLGSGTTMQAARELRRNCIGVELEDSYIDLIKRNVNWDTSLDGQCKFEFKEMKKLKNFVKMNGF